MVFDKSHHKNVLEQINVTEIEITSEILHITCDLNSLDPWNMQHMHLFMQKTYSEELCKSNQKL